MLLLGSVNNVGKLISKKRTNAHFKLEVENEKKVTVPVGPVPKASI